MPRAGQVQARVDVDGAGEAQVSTGVPGLDHVVALLAQYASFDLSLEVAPGEAEAEIAAAGRALGQALHDALRAEGCRRHGSAVVPADEALAHVTVEASGRPLVVANIDLSDARVAGLASDMVATFLHELAEGAGREAVRQQEEREEQRAAGARLQQGQQGDGRAQAHAGTATAAGAELVDAVLMAYRVG